MPAKTTKTEEEVKVTEEKAAVKKTTARKTAAKKETEGEAGTAKKAAAKTTKTAAAKTTRTAAKPKKAAAKAEVPEEVKEAPAEAEEVKETAAPVTEPAAAPEVPAEPVKRSLLFVAAECQPFSGTGGLGEVSGSLPTALAAMGKYDVCVMSPYYRDMPWEWKEKCEFVKYFYVKLSWRSQYCGIFKLEKDGVTYYFVDNEYYFGRDGLYGYYDDGERFAFFCKAVMDSMGELGYYPDIVHTNDWQAALIPVYNKFIYHYGFKSVFTIHNIAFQGQYSLDILGSVFDLPEEARSTVEYNGCINLMKGAIETSYMASTVSKTYVTELENGFYAYNMEDIIKRNSFKMRGILNGINYVAYNPADDANIEAPFTAEDLSGKARDKQHLQEMLGLTVDPDAALVAIITRLTGQKGLSLVRPVIESLLGEHMQLVVLGVGEIEYEDFFKYLENRYPGKVSANIMFNGGLSHRIYAGADMFLMPSLTEPCGLAQMISCRYGTVPIVRETGGLKDSIKDCSMGEGNGFTFSGLDSRQLEDAVRRALSLYRNKEDWDKLRKHIMTIDFSWAKSALEYDEMFSQLF